ncbi:NERD domain-containing protein [Bacillus sp. S3]|uniref:nuclease-related domain-containing protein n=1 Tax=Bacillus sp. S3 TaxID=486398 RepID=UPI00118A541B|nr:nuclease-related domain-containing protein [Bacillus sp. S3]QCJ40477.1 NERD domain-containing protein [Bacillus sp. S3]
MAYKSRPVPKKLMILRLLNTHLTLSENDKQYYYNLKKGYEGELKFDSLTEKLQCQCYILNDLLFKVNNTLFQIDTLIIFSGRIHFSDVKNFEGDYFLESERLYKKPETEYTNPLLQLTRSKSLLRQLLQSIGFHFPVDANVVFINPEFTLYQAPLNIPFIFPTQVNSYLKYLDATPSKLGVKEKELADKLISLHREEDAYKHLPPYKYGQFRKGMTCEKCNCFAISVCGQKCVCGDCGHEEKVTAAVFRSVKELQLLFPDMKITANVVHDWCRVVTLKKTIRRILEDNFNRKGVRQWTYYE